MVDKGFFGGLFDFNGDGNLDDFERAADFSAFMQIVENEENGDDCEADEDEDNAGDDF